MAPLAGAITGASQPPLVVRRSFRPDDLATLRDLDRRDLKRRNAHHDRLAPIVERQIQRGQQFGVDDLGRIDSAGTDVANTAARFTNLERGDRPAGLVRILTVGSPQSNGRRRRSESVRFRLPDAVYPSPAIGAAP